VLDERRRQVQLDVGMEAPFVADADERAARLVGDVEVAAALDRRQSRAFPRRGLLEVDARQHRRPLLGGRQRVRQRQRRGAGRRKGQHGEAPCVKERHRRNVTSRSPLRPSVMRFTDEEAH